ncbi:MAG: tRNA 2-selenouridine(34) synthase MnmH [Pseudotabrizicola sp.]|uniref:tRNA 2-selenouridine(34) synthase MnmH n=1 Tax=Pseudotabrizicola sp. TaxID=2939647 RepID=UPI00272FC8E7|nr:tRNA 2-selenouridine(34) synthase MnmH [Pseudotabrizicola sp.]MDP2082173.1 tRNA 2-selenouridine(34) synthase MnmH [Pseudotabrizicola sp.]MDZ7573212.1 tRNA 2-selenouridine(34) synthase MnmH [Pseudotabrizicola sp.]
MAIELTSLADVLASRFDDIIDVRAPAEYADDHLPGAISLPVLDDAERARVGTIYKQVSPFDARKIGAALVAKNAAAHLMGPLADRPGSWQPLVYCWRGGQRSNSFASILSQIGWRVQVISGGYKTWRSLVVQALYDQPFPCPLIVLDGNTGTAKTEVLNHLPAQGVQVIDLEGLANHRGSLFGAMGPQPSQRSFEGQLAVAITRLDPARPVVVEAESSKIGDLRLPAGLWRAMVQAPRIAISAPLDARARYLSHAYTDLVSDSARLDAALHQLRPSHSAERIAEWQDLAQTDQFTALASGLMQHHYDPRYAKHRTRSTQAMTELTTPTLDQDQLPDLARRIASALHQS